MIALRGSWSVNYAGEDLNCSFYIPIIHRLYLWFHMYRYQVGMPPHRITRYHYRYSCRIYLPVEVRTGKNYLLANGMFRIHNTWWGTTRYWYQVPGTRCYIPVTIHCKTPRHHVGRESEWVMMQWYSYYVRKSVDDLLASLHRWLSQGGHHQCKTSCDTSHWIG